MINASKYKSKSSDEIPTIKHVECPACNKPRLGKYLNADGSVDEANQETVEVRDEQRHLEVCGFCADRYRKADEKFVKDNIEKLAKAFQEGRDDDGDSDHKDFSLN